ncbi:MAG: chitobiase/beta-hexosaminidase C-terminal domain-containing protein [Muribaculaceae bacterium]|nr:chitobiase/beta-hexosaminidase C-terminal domain-containing protein [Muribaculaceae bacterium]
MKKLFSLLTLALLTMSAWAQTTVTFTAGTDLGSTSTNGSADEVTKDGITITCNDAAFATAQYRFYAGSTATITSTVGNITKIEFTCTATGTNNYGPGNSTYTVGNYTTNGSVGTWTGDAATVEFTTEKQMRATQIVVTIGGEVVETLAAPTLPAAQSFNDSFEVTISHNDSEATIKYSTDDMATWNTYTAPFTITETTKVYAKAEKGDLVSEIVSATYTKNTPVTGTCIVFNYADDEAITTAAEYTVTRPGASFTVSNGMINGHYRIYKNQTIAFTSTAGNIIRIEFDGVSGNPASNFGEVTGMAYEGNNGVWVGSAQNVTFTATLNQVRCTEIRVYVDGELPVVTVAAPTIPASQDFEESITVEITNNEDGATIYYKTNGDWTEYTGALTFTETTTLQAKAVKGTDESEVVTATYTLVEPVEPINTLAEVNVLPTTTDFTFDGDAVVTVQRGAYLWLRDNSGYGLIYGNINGQSDVTFPAGTVLSQGWTAQTKIFNGLMEYVNAANVSASGNTNANLAAIQEITALDTTMVNAYVQVKNVKSFTASGKNVTATMTDGTTMVMYNTFSESIPEEEGNYTVDGVVSTHNGLQLIILGIEGYVPQTNDVNSISEVYELSENSTFTMYNDVVVTYQNGTRMWIRDTENASGLIYGTVEGTFANGDVLSDGWSAKYTVYNSVPEFTEPQDIAASGDTRDADPFERTAITNDNVNEYVIMKGLSLLTDANNAKRFYNAADSLVFFNTFNVELPTIEEGKTYDVTGIVTIYYGNPQIYITEITEVADDVMRGDVDKSGNVSIADVTTLIDMLLSGAEMIPEADCDLNGSMTIADVTTLIDYLLTGNWPE